MTTRAHRSPGSARGTPAPFAPAFGALMVAAAARPAGVWGLAVLAAAAGAVVAGAFVRRAAAVAVLLAVVAIGLGDPAPLFAVVAGLSAAAYLVTAYAGGATTLTAPTAAGMLGFAAAGAVVTAVPLRLAWAPLTAPVIIAAILILVAAPLVAGAAYGPDGRAGAAYGPDGDREPPG